LGVYGFSYVAYVIIVIMLRKKIIPGLRGNDLE
jgi:hypothetical protein